MPTADDPQSPLERLATADGAIWTAWIDPASSEILAIHGDGSSSRHETVERVLSEAVMAAGNALGERLGLGTAIETTQTHQGGGLLFRRLADGQLLVVRHAPGIALSHLRLAMREAAADLEAKPAVDRPEPSAEIWIDPSPTGHGAAPDPFAPMSDDVAPRNQHKISS